MTALVHSTRRLATTSLAIVRCDLAAAAQYRANLAVWAIANLLQLIVYLSVWRAVADASGGSTGGYTASEFAGYFLALLVVRELTRTWLPFEFAGWVRSGNIVPLFARPFHPMVHIYVAVFAYGVQNLILLPIAACVLFFAFDASIETTWQALAVTPLIIILAGAARAMLDAWVAVLALWLTRIDGIRSIYYFTVLLIGGQFAPIGVMPDWLQVVAKALPFYWTLGYPTELIIGRADASDAWIGATVLLVWTVGLYVAFRPVWRRGMRAYEAVGG